MDILIDYDGDAGPCDEIHKIAERYDHHYGLIGHTNEGTMTLTVETDDLEGLTAELAREGIGVLNVQD